MASLKYNGQGQLAQMSLSKSHEAIGKLLGVVEISPDGTLLEHSSDSAVDVSWVRLGACPPRSAPQVKRPRRQHWGTVTALGGTWASLLMPLGSQLARAPCPHAPPR